MLQIKTIKCESKEEKKFDELVNAALAEGWRLTKREIIPPFSAAGYIAFQLLYAELEREVITEAEKGCENCKYYEQQPESEPCRSCSDDCDKWEAPDA
jgi:hypothetical protein